MAISKTQHDADTEPRDPQSDSLHEDVAEAADMPTPFWGVASGSSIKALRVASRNETVSDHGHTINGADFPTPRNAEISFATANKTGIWEGPNWFIDCGGFSELGDSDDGTYQSDLSEYIDYLLKHVNNGIDIKYWALRDWPVTKQLLREHDRTERDHQRWTIRDHHRSLELADEAGLLDKPGVNPISVLQGQDTSGYLWMLETLQQSGLLTEHVCIGSLKSLSHQQVEDVAEAVRSALPDDHTLHGLGITKAHLAHSGVREHFDTIDTQCWNHQTKRLPTTLDDVKNTWIGYLHAFQQYIEVLQEQTETVSDTQQATGTSLFEFAGGQQSVTGHTSSDLIECVCGTTIDPNAVIDFYDENVRTENTELQDALDGPGCRNCKRKLIAFQDQCLGDIPEQLPRS